MSEFGLLATFRSAAFLSSTAFRKAMTSLMEMLLIFTSVRLQRTYMSH
ncbi:Uncharacterised protein [Mycobacterium tuberculosis]|nr:Uncharacterised protein [Mycobacterium tuberculosis]